MMSQGASRDDFFLYGERQIKGKGVMRTYLAKARVARLGKGA